MELNHGVGGLLPPPCGLPPPSVSVVRARFGWRRRPLHKRLRELTAASDIEAINTFFNYFFDFSLGDFIAHPYCNNFLWQVVSMSPLLALFFSYAWVAAGGYTRCYSAFWPVAIVHFCSSVSGPNKNQLLKTNLLSGYNLVTEPRKTI